MRNVTINPVLNGWVCNVGCQTVVFDSKTRLMQCLSDYLDNPEKVEKEFVEKAVNKMVGPEVAPAPVGRPI